MESVVSFPGGDVRYIENVPFQHFNLPVPPEQCIVITDSNVARLYAPLLREVNKIVIPAGEAHKSLETIAGITDELVAAEIHKHSLLIGIGGGVITDLTGFVASVYMRGLSFGFVPTTLLGMVDAAIGGKNGINAGQQKNLIGTITQPSFILLDTSFLATLPRTEWQNGFAEIIKYACIFDADLFDELASHNLDYYIQNKSALQQVIRKCVTWKNKIVQADEADSHTRKLLNFGHTVGHAIEILYGIRHGHAVAIGMMVANSLSNTSLQNELLNLLHLYELPTGINLDTQKVMQVLRMDKKRNQDTIDYIVLNKKGEGIIKPLSFDVIENALTTFAHAGSY